MAPGLKEEKNEVMVNLQDESFISYKQSTKVISSYNTNFENSKSKYESRKQNPDFDDENSLDGEFA